MTDVRLTIVAEDGQVYPVLGNTKGELKLEEPTVNSDDYVAKTGDNMTGDLTLGDDKITLDATDGIANFYRSVSIGNVLDPNYSEPSQANIRLQLAGSNSLGIGCELNLQNRGQGGDVANIITSTTRRSSVTGYSGMLKFDQNGILSYGAKNPATDPTDLPDATINLDGRTGEVRIAGVTRIGDPDNADPLSSVAAGVRISNNGLVKVKKSVGGSAFSVIDESNETNVLIGSTGNAEFSGDVIVGSRSKRWMLVEQGGLCHMVEQATASNADLSPSAIEYPPLRDVIAELNSIEKALGEVMERLRMKPPAGWEVWDGSSENS